MHRDRVCAIEIWNECFKMGGYNRMKKSDAKEINSILERMPDWERQKSPLRFGGEYGNQRGFLRRNIVPVNIRPPDANVYKGG